MTTIVGDVTGLQQCLAPPINRASDISRDFQGQIHGKIGRFHGIFAGKKSKFVGKSADFARFS